MSFFRKRKKEPEIIPTGPIEYLIVGLGNPTTKYENTRHNTGHLFIDYYSENNNFSVKKLKFKSLYADTMISGKRCIVLKPQTYMNLSGEAVRDAAEFYKIPTERIVVIFDDINIPVGNMRIRRKGSAGGHNGIKNIIYHLNSDNFPRIKIGVGKHSDGEDLKDYVLDGFSKVEAEAVKKVFEDVGKALELIVNDNIDEAMNKYSK
jgi:PTH1 family peptidyl-tRNA hydrolase